MNLKDKNIIALAKELAREVHKHTITEGVSGYKRPYTEHLQEVADLVWVSEGDETEIAAAWLHDSVEDTDTTLVDLAELINKDVSALVEKLTDLTTMTGLPVEQRKVLQAERIKTESSSAKRIKLADQISNVRFITSDPSVKWLPENNRKYAIGARLIADACKGISPVLDELFDREYQKAVTHFKL